MKRNNKKGFTIVELIIVIAIIAVLAAVLIPTFSNLIKKANQSKDTQLVKNLNTALSIETSTSNDQLNIYEALTLAELNGMIIDYLSPSAEGYEYVYNQDESLFLLVDFSQATPEVVYPEKQTISQNKHFWRFATKQDDFANADYSWCLGRNYTDTTTEVEVNSGVADLKGVLQLITYAPTNATADNLYFYTSNANCNFYVNNSSATVTHEGNANVVYVEDIAPNSYHSHANVVGSLIAQSGHVVFEADSHTNVLAVVDTYTPDLQVKEGATFGLYGKIYEFATGDDADITIGDKKFKVTDKTMLPTPSQGTVQGCNHKDDNNDKTCDLCGNKMPTISDALADQHSGHTNADCAWRVTQEATCEKPGSHELYCEKCNSVIYTEEIPALGHDYTITVVQATCTATGLETKHCSRCSDHQETVSGKISHTEQTLPAVPATCAETGLTEGTKCSVCGEIIIEQTTIEKLNHSQDSVNSNDEKDWALIENEAPTCQTTGQSYWYCNICEIEVGILVETAKVEHKDENSDGMCDFGCGTEIGDIIVTLTGVYDADTDSYVFTIPEDTPKRAKIQLDFSLDTAEDLDSKGNAQSAPIYYYNNVLKEPGCSGGFGVVIKDKSGHNFDITGIDFSNEKLYEYFYGQGAYPVDVTLNENGIYDTSTYFPNITESSYFNKYLATIGCSDATEYIEKVKTGTVQTYAQYLKTTLGVSNLMDIFDRNELFLSMFSDSMSPYMLSTLYNIDSSIANQWYDSSIDTGVIAGDNTKVSHVEQEVIDLLMRNLYESVNYAFLKPTDNPNTYDKSLYNYTGFDWREKAKEADYYYYSVYELINDKTVPDGLAKNFQSETSNGITTTSGQIYLLWHGCLSSNLYQSMTIFSLDTMVIEMTAQ